MVDVKYDFVIVGGGTAGLVLAARLSEEIQNKILVVEAGEDQSTDPRVTTPAFWPTLIGSTSDWNFRTTDQQGLGGRTNVYPQGRILGGSSALNAHAFIAPAKTNIDAWEKLGNNGWNWTKLSSYFQKCYTLTSPSQAAVKHLSLDYIDEEVRGTHGPLQLSFPDEFDNIWARAWLDTWAACDLSISADPFSGNAVGAYINAESLTSDTKQRSFSANAYLAPALSRGNVTVVTGALVEKVLFESTESNDVVAKGIQYSKEGKSETVDAHEVILSAGSINSARLLELSGVGDAELLRKHGIPVVVDNPNVGENLQNHPMISTSFEVRDDVDTMDSLVRQEPAALQAATEAYKKQAGPFANGGTFASAVLPYPNIKTTESQQELEQLIKASESYASSNPSSHLRSFSYHASFVHSILKSPNESSIVHISYPGYAIPAIDGSGASPPTTGKYFTLVQLLSYPLSRGSTHIASPSASGPVALDPKYFSHPLDIEILARQLIHATETITNPKSEIGKLLKPGGKRNDGAERATESVQNAKEYCKQQTVGAYHATGTCAMMPSEKGGVVDEKLRVYGVKGLRVCDASIIPITMRANPQATVYAVAEYGADLIRESA